MSGLEEISRFRGLDKIFSNRELLLQSEKFPEMGRNGKNNFGSEIGFPDGRFRCFGECYHTAFKVLPCFRSFDVLRLFHVSSVTSMSKDSIEKNPETNRTTNPADPQRNQSNPPIVTSKTKAAISPDGDTQPAHTAKENRERTKLGLEITGLAVLIVYTAFSGCQACYSRQQAGAAIQAANDATESLTTLKTQFQMDQRPYVIVLGMSTVNFKLQKARPATKGQPLVVNIVMKNVGKSPALNVIIHRHLVYGNDQLEQLFRPEPLDMTKSQDVIAQGEVDTTTAMSVKDTFAIETADVPAPDIVNWDGGEPIIVLVGLLTKIPSATLIARHMRIGTLPLPCGRTLPTSSMSVLIRSSAGSRSSVR